MKLLDKILKKTNTIEIELNNIFANIYVENNLLKNIYEIVQSYSQSCFLIADSNTVNLISKNSLEKFDHYVISTPYTASIGLINTIKKHSKNKNLLVALGSGTINDICKYICYTEKKDYILFPTAASMNGYTSANSSITLDNGLKQSLQGKLAKAIYADIKTITDAPMRMTISGFADFICRSTAQADWLLSHLLLDTEYNELPFLLTQEIEQELIKEHKGLLLKDEITINLLLQSLIASGFGMLIVQSSCPASQGEHMIASCMEYINNNKSDTLLHGEKIAVTTLTMASIQQKILSNKLPKIKTSSLNKEDIITFFDKSYNKKFLDIYENKFINENKANSLNNIISKKWQEIVNQIGRNFLYPDQLREILINVNCPTTAKELSWNENLYNKAVNLSFITKNRFTFLDLAHHIDN